MRNDAKLIDYVNNVSEKLNKLLTKLIHIGNDMNYIQDAKMNDSRLDHGFMRKQDEI